MPAPLSEDIRNRIVQLYDLSGATYEYVAEALCVGRATVSRVLRLRRETGSVAPRPATGGVPARLQGSDLALLKTMVDEEPDVTLEALTDRWNTEHPARAVSVSTIGRRVRNLGYTRKKSRCGPPK